MGVKRQTCNAAKFSKTCGMMNVPVSNLYIILKLPVVALLPFPA